MTIHYQMSYEEVRAERYTCRSDYNERPHPLCRNGGFHISETRDQSLVDCPACLAKLPKGT